MDESELFMIAFVVFIIFLSIFIFKFKFDACIQEGFSKDYCLAFATR